MPKSSYRNHHFILATALALGGILASYHSTKSLTPSSPFDLEKTVITKSNQEARREMRLTPQPVQTENKTDRARRIEAYGELLDEASKQLKKTPADISDHATSPEKTLILSEEGGETIEVTFADGSKSYYPNNETYDPSDGSFHPKEF